LGNLDFDIGFNPVLPGGALWQLDEEKIAVAMMETIGWTLIVEVTGLYATYIAAKVLSLSPVTALCAAFGLIAKTLFYIGLMYNSWNDKAAMFATALIGLILLLFVVEVNIGRAFMKWISPYQMAALEEIDEAMVAIGLPFEWLRTWVDAAEILTDLALALIAYARFEGKI
jgi:hypothetical protein